MRHTDLRNLVLSTCVITLMTGCNNLPGNSAATTQTGATSTSNSTATALSGGVGLSKVSVIVGTNGSAPTLVYHATDSSGSTPYAELEGCFPALDGRGNVYMLAFYGPWGCGDHPSSIDVYSPGAVGGAAVRSLPVGPGTKIANVNDMAVSSAGEIFINDGNGVAVFSAAANGSDAPVRYIQWDSGEEAPVTPGYIAVDGQNNLYVQNKSSIAVFGPHDTGLVLPSRVISGPHTQLGGGLGRMTTDAKGNLYVACDCPRSDELNQVGVYEFAPDATGDAVPLRYVTGSPSIWDFDGFIGVGVDSSGVIYLRATYPYCGAIFVFPADASGSTTPLNVIGGDCPAYDIDGTIAIFSGS